jgi:hypothetical protein
MVDGNHILLFKWADVTSVSAILLALALADIWKRKFAI